MTRSDGRRPKRSLHRAWAGISENPQRICGWCTVALLVSFFLGCSAIPEDPAALAAYADSSVGRAAATEMCRSMRRFVSAPLDSSGLRRAWFLPMDNYDDGSFDFYAPMASAPSDSASKAFYQRKVGQLTHYLRAPEFAAALAGCLAERHGYTRVCQTQTPGTFRATFRQVRSERSIEIAAADESTRLLIAKKGWNGSVQQSLVYPSTGDATNTSVQPTCVEP